MTVMNKSKHEIMIEGLGKTIEHMIDEREQSLARSTGYALWMAEWVRSGCMNWSVVPDDIQDKCNFESDVSELVANAMTEILSHNKPEE